MIYQETNLIDAYDKDLTFKGLKIIYDMQKGLNKIPLIRF